VIDPSAWDALDEQVILLLRLVAFIAFLILFGGWLSHSRRPSGASDRRASMAVGALWGGFAYVQAAALAARLFEVGGNGLALTIAVVSCGVALVSAWAFWPWRAEE
jgi:hypothetical protein